MKHFIIKINNVAIISVEAKDLKKAFKEIKKQLPNLLSFPHFWCLACCPNKIPLTIPEKIIFFSKPYKYYMEYKNDLERVDKIETNKGYYFHGENIIKCIKDVNYLVTSSDTSEDNTSVSVIAITVPNTNSQKKHKIRKNKIRKNKIRKKRMRLMGCVYKKVFSTVRPISPLSDADIESSISDASTSSISSQCQRCQRIHPLCQSLCPDIDDFEELLNKQITYYIKKYMTYKVFIEILNTCNENKEIDEIYGGDNMEIITDEKSQLNCYKCNLYKCNFQ